MKSVVFCSLLVCAILGASVAEAGDLGAGFADPPVAARPGAYWCWLNGDVTHAQITRDLEEMKAKGMGGAEIWDVQALRNPGNFVPAGPAFLSEQSLDSIAHAIRESTRLNLRLGLIASSGWNAGGSWVPPKYAGKGLFWSQTTLEGPAKIEQVLPFPRCDRAPKQPDGMPVFFKEIAVLAVPAGKTLESINDVADLSRHMDAGGKLKWNVPAGKWTVLRFVCSNHGQHLIVPSPKSNGPMIDFIDPAATEFHLRHMMDKILAKLGRKDFRGTALKFMEFDSMELARGVLWSDNFAEDFTRLRGYGPIPYLPLLAGWELADDDLNNRFHYDFKRALSDQLIFSHYVTGSRLLREYGLVLVAEAGGPGPPIWNSCPVDAIKALGAVDVPRGEFWIANRNMFLIKEIASASHVYGKKLVDAESFTTWRRWIDGPVAHKRLADRALCEGLNHFTFHTFASSPREAGVPGRAYHAGTDINTTTTWWPKAKPFMDYLSRCAFMLRQGRFVADVCFYYGDQAPNFYPAFHSVPRKIVPEPLGLGYDYDVCDTQSILTRMRVEGGRIVLPDGMSYVIMALPKQDFMPLNVLQKIEKLVAAGATVVGAKPMRSTGLQSAAENDGAVKRLADKLWGKCDGETVTVNRYGKGRILWGPSWCDVLANKGVGPDFHVVNEAERDNLDYIHRRTADREIYFVRNKTMASKTLDCVFRVEGGQPQYWNPLSGKIERSGDFEAVDGGTKVSLTLPPAGSVFVVFSELRANDRTTTAEGVTYLDQSNVSPALKLERSWRLSFSKRFGTPEPIMFDRLQSWTESPDPGVKYFSGVVTYDYEKTFDLPETTAKDVRRLTLDLGEVKEVAEVYVNGRSVGVVWTPPYRVDISAAARPGENELKVEVINLLANRLIGDRAYPAGGRYTKSNIQALRADSPLLPSGLLGPVRVFAE